MRDIREPKEHGGNIVYTRLKERGYQVFAVNPNTARVQGDRAYPDLTSIPGGVEAVVIATRPEHAEATVREAANLGMTKVLLMRRFDESPSPAATALGRAARHRHHRRPLPVIFSHGRRWSQGDVRPAQAHRQGAPQGLAGQVAVGPGGVGVDDVPVATNACAAWPTDPA